MRLLTTLGIFLGASAFCSVDINPLATTLQTSTCQEWIDGADTPHLHAANSLSLFACWGFVHGRDRAWQVDFLRKTAQGRRSEIIGFDGLKMDVMMRLLDLPGYAQRIFKTLPVTAQEQLWAYSWGMNRGFEEALRQGVPEFQDLGYKPDTWIPSDSLVILLLQSFDQTRIGLEEDLKEEKEKQKFGQEAAALFNPDGLPWDRSILKPGDFSARPSTAQLPNNETSLFSPSLKNLPAAPEGVGSNNWAVSPQHSATGHAWLANDPHLGLVFPPFWYFVHVEGGDLDAIGASVPGTPVIASGANRYTAWGLTSSLFGVAQVVEVPRSEILKAETLHPLIWIRWKGLQLPFFFKGVQRLGPTLPILPIEAPPGKAYVLRWTGYLTKPEDFAAFDGLMKARSSKELSENISKLGLPSWNFAFADIHGNIGLRTSGILPKMEGPHSFGVQRSTVSELSHWPVLSASEAPHIMNPARGYLSSANNRHWPSEAPFHSGGAVLPSFRASRIEELLQTRKKHDFASMRDMQCDLRSEDAPYFIPYFVQFLQKARPEFLSESLRQTLVSTLQKWDFQATLDCTACGLYRRWMNLLKTDTQMNEVALYREFHSARPQDMNAALTRTLRSTVQDLHLQEGKSLPPWGKIHSASFPHLSGMARFNSTERLPTPGDSFALNTAHVHWDEGQFQVTTGVSERLIVEMTSPPTVWATLAGPNRAARHPGFSGQVWKEWIGCDFQKKTFPVNWSAVSTHLIYLGAPRSFHN